MLTDFNIISEILQQPKNVSFVIQLHSPRSGSEHYDLRFGNSKNEKELYSFAAPKNLLQTINTKTVLAKTRMHNMRWLDLPSYRLKIIDKGIVTVNISTSKYFELNFHGKILNGSYKLFQMKNKRRDDYWLLTKVNIHE